nr:uncharacterized protein LOC128680302 [Plodia interpunctella]
MVIRPVVLYGSECWATKVTDERRLPVAEMRMLRWMCGVTRMDKIRNEYARGNLKVAPIIGKLESNRLRWYGHVMRREENNIVRKVMDVKLNGKRNRGRPKKRWIECIRQDMAKKEILCLVV